MSVGPKNPNPKKQFEFRSEEGDNIHLGDFVTILQLEWNAKQIPGFKCDAKSAYVVKS